MATPAAQKTLTASELKRMQERAQRTAQQATEAEDALFLAQAEATEQREVKMLKDRLTSAMEDASHIDVAELRHDFSDAVKDLAAAKKQEAEALDLKNHALVIMSRRAFQASIHPAIVGSGKQNISKAGEALGMPYSTIRPYVIAGGALFQQDRAFLLSEPDAEDARIVNGSFDAHSRKDQIAKRQRAALKQQQQQEQLLKQQAEIEALKQQQAQQQQAPAQGGEQAPATDQQQQAPATDQQAPATGAQAPAQDQQQDQQQAPASSVTEDILKAARDLARMGKAQRKTDNAQWQKTHAKVVDILSELFPTIGK